VKRDQNVDSYTGFVAPLGETKIIDQEFDAFVWQSGRIVQKLRKQKGILLQNSNLKIKRAILIKCLFLFAR
jgi:hypothetical protein